MAKAAKGVAMASLTLQLRRWERKPTAAPEGLGHCDVGGVVEAEHEDRHGRDGLPPPMRPCMKPTAVIDR